MDKGVQKVDGEQMNRGVMQKVDKGVQKVDGEQVNRGVVQKVDDEELDGEIVQETDDKRIDGEVHGFEGGEKMEQDKKWVEERGVCKEEALADQVKEIHQKVVEKEDRTESEECMESEVVKQNVRGDRSRKHGNRESAHQVKDISADVRAPEASTDEAAAAHKRSVSPTGKFQDDQSAAGHDAKTPGLMAASEVDKMEGSEKKAKQEQEMDDEEEVKIYLSLSLSFSLTIIIYIYMYMYVYIPALVCSVQEWLEQMKEYDGRPH